MIHKLLRLSPLAFAFASILCSAAGYSTARADYFFHKIVDSSQVTSFNSGSLNDAGQVAFWSVENGFELIRVWDSQTNSFTIVERLTYTGTRQLSNLPSINDLGQVAYARNPQSGFSNAYIWDPNTSKSAQVGNQGNDIAHIDINNAGTIAYTTQESSGYRVYRKASSGPTESLYNAGDPSVVINNSGQILSKRGNSVLIDNVQIEDPFFTVYSPAPQMNDAGEVVFAADNNNSPEPLGIYRDGLNQSAQLVINGADFTSLASGRIYINNAGAISFTGMKDGQRGLFLDGLPIIAEGDTLDGNVITSIGSGFLNNQNQVAFSALFENGTRGYYLGVSAVPEPSSILLVIFSTAALGLRRRRR